MRTLALLIVICSSAVAAAERGFPEAGPWVSFYGKLSEADTARVAAAFRIINLDADPDLGNVSDAQLQALRAGGQNRVLSYLNLGSCERFRSYWSACVKTGALTTTYDGYPEEKWANLANVAYRDLLVNVVAPRLVARGVDGFYLDNLEVVEHGPSDRNGPCDAACAQGGLDLVWELRQRFPELLIVMQNATGSVTREGRTHGVAFASLLDGVAREEAYAPAAGPDLRDDLLRWKAMNLEVNGRPLWIADEEYVGSCSAKKRSAAAKLRERATADGVAIYVTDASSRQRAPCFW